MTDLGPCLPVTGWGPGLRSWRTASERVTFEPQLARHPAALGSPCGADGRASEWTAGVARAQQGQVGSISAFSTVPGAALSAHKTQGGLFTEQG